MGLVVLIIVIVEEGPAEATFPGKNGRIAYNGNGVIYTVHPDGSGKTKVTNTPAGYPIDYSPDGKKIAYTSYAQKDAEIYTINVDGTGKFQVTNNSTNDFTPDDSPDGKKIVYFTLSALSGKIYTINVGGGGKSKVTEGLTPS